ncbi:hypothetical protein [Bacillus vallismortis]|uniref:hypothetical protein n=1 Tax=Bacillus vallismortis TaxID=72361 RepID=UPI002281B8B3|nr:hypothetical protein [Bacillus vallismortis]MCY8311058.1 hypothetical protein [Bacillus vallismortis]MCY8599144.1 hypothetical protein [Bacillus vallismortis]
MILRVLFLLVGCGFWIYFQHDYRPDMKANLALIGAIISFTAAYFKDIDKYIEKREDK